MSRYLAPLYITLSDNSPPDEPPERGRPTRAPPHNIAAEEAVLGAMLLSRVCYC